MPAQGYRNAIPIVIPAPWNPEEALRQRQLEQQQREAQIAEQRRLEAERQQAIAQQQALELQRQQQAEAERQQALDLQREQEQQQQEAELKRQQAEQHRQERLAQKEQERQEKIARKEQARQERIAQEERRRQAEADRREQERQAEIARQAAIQAAWELEQFKKQFNNGIVGGIALGVLLLFIPGYRVHAQDRLFHFKEWPFKGFFIVSSLALGGFIALLNDGISSLDTGHVAAFVGLFGIPAAFYVPGLVLLFFNYLHYLFVPHPAEEYLNRAANSRTPELREALRAAESMYQPGSGNVFDEWRARNHKRRVEAMTALLKKENEAMEALIKNQKQKADLNDRKRS
jgi:chemotaxis protein histidine kinase CheA